MDAKAFPREKNSARGENPEPQEGMRIRSRPITMSRAAASKRQQSLLGTGTSLPTRSAAAQGEADGRRGTHV